MAVKGIYVLILRLHKDNEIIIGKLGKVRFKKGFYAYTGSALGTGGFKRVTRHFNVAEGRNHVRKWHIDHLLPHSEVICAILLPTEETLECKIAAGFAEVFREITGFGCTDCSCRSHLFFTRTNIENKSATICKILTGIESIIIRPDI